MSRHESGRSVSWTSSALILYAVLLASAFFLIWRNWPRPQESGDDPTAKARPVGAPAEATSEEKQRIAVFLKAKASVVNIASAELRRDLATLSLQFVPKGSGTGLIWDEKGRVVTNYHVVEGAKRVVVTLDDHSTANVSQIRYDKAHDLAVLWTDIPVGKRKPIEIGPSSKLQVGQNVLAIGNPFGLDHSLSAGIISSLSRSISNESGQTMRGLIQTDAAINPGNSGGPLLDSSGRLIGVNTAIISPSGGNAGIGFAIPSDVVNRVVPRLIAGTNEARAGLGIVEAPDQWAQALGIVGVPVMDVLANSPAEKVRIRPTRRDENGAILLGDIIVGINEHKIRSAGELFDVLADHCTVGQEVTVHILRGREVLAVKMTLAAGLR